METPETKVITLDLNLAEVAVRIIEGMSNIERPEAADADAALDVLGDEVRARALTAARSVLGYVMHEFGRAMTESGAGGLIYEGPIEHIN